MFSNDRMCSLSQVSQIQFANVILLNKVDLAKKADLEQIRGVISTLNSSAKVFETVRSEVPLENVLNTGLFDLEKAWFRNCCAVDSEYTLSAYLV